MSANLQHAQRSLEANDSVKRDVCRLQAHGLSASEDDAVMNKGTRNEATNMAVVWPKHRGWDIMQDQLDVPHIQRLSACPIARPPCERFQIARQKTFRSLYQLLCIGAIQTGEKNPHQPLPLLETWCAGLPVYRHPAIHDERGRELSRARDA